MARVYQEANDDGVNNEHIDTIKKALEIQDILINDPPNDKRFNNNSSKYLLDYITILNDVKNSDYSDAYIVSRINSLYNKIFKHRRY